MSLIHVQDLLKILEDSSPILLDASWYLPAAKRNAEAEYRAAHLPGAQFFNIDAICDSQSIYPHMLPSEEVFTDAVSALGVRSDDHVVIYDSSGVFSAPRAWWMFRVFGHSQVSVLNGGINAWRQAGGTVHAGIADGVPRGDFRALFQSEYYADIERVNAACEDSSTVIVDARSPGRFSGIDPEPREGLSSGCMPGAINLPFNDCIDKVSGQLMPPEQLEQVFSEVGVPADGDIITTCGSGITACVLALALDQTGRSARVYDGSWVEWATKSSKVPSHG